MCAEANRINQERLGGFTTTESVTKRLTVTARVRHTDVCMTNVVDELVADVTDFRRAFVLDSKTTTDCAAVATAVV